MLMHDFPDRSQWYSILYDYNRNPKLRYQESSISEYVRKKSLLRQYFDIVSTIDSLQRKMGKRSFRMKTESEIKEMSDGPPSLPTMARENLSDMEGLAKDIVYDEKSDYFQQGQEEILNIARFFQRPVEITDFTVAIGASVSVELDIWNLYTINPTIRAKLRNYAYFKADLVVTLVVSGTPFHFGRALVSYQPYPERNQTILSYEAQFAGLGAAVPRLAFLNYLSQSPTCGSISFGNNRPVEIRIPYLSTKPMHRLFNADASALSAATPYADLENAGRLYIYSINDLNASSDSATDVSVQVYCHAENVSLGAPTATHIAITTESAIEFHFESQDEFKVGPVEKISSSIAHVSSLLTEVPVIGKFAKASQIVFGGVSKFAALFGWSRPVGTNPPEFIKNRPYANGALTIGSETTERLVLDPMQEITVDPTIGGTNKDELVIKNISGIESFLTKFSWTETDTLMADPIFLLRIHPNQCTMYEDATTRWYQPTAMAYAVAPFEYWRGDIEIRLEIVCSSYHRGKLGIFYEPNIAQEVLIDADISLNKNFFHIIDLQEVQSQSFCVTWAFPRAWARNMPIDGPINNYGSFFSPSTNSYNYVNGYLGVVPFTELTSPNSSPVEINVYVSCKNLRVNQFLGDRLPTDRALFSALLGPEEEKEFLVESEMKFEYESKTLYDTDVSCVELNRSTASDQHISEEHFGEEPLSFRSLLKRYTTVSLPSTTAGGAGALTLQYINEVYPTPQPAYAGSATFFSLFGYLRYAFMGIRGSMRHRLRLATDTMAMGVLGTVVTSIRAPSGAVSSTLSWVTSKPIMQMIGSSAYVPFTNGGVEFEVPFYSNNLFAFSFADDLIGTNAVGEMDALWSRGFQARVSLEDNSSTDTTIVDDIATGEDFNFLRYSGAPFYSVSLV